MAAPASAAEAPRNQGAACVQAGLSTLKSLGLLQAAASKQLDQPAGSATAALSHLPVWVTASPPTLT